MDAVKPTKQNPDNINMAGDILASLGSSISLLKELHELGKKAQYAEVMKGIADLSLDLSNMTISAATLQNENNDLKNEIKRMLEIQDMELIIKDKAYYDSKNDIYYCLTCFNNGKYLSAMCTWLDCDNYLTCPKCKYKNN